MNLKSAKKLLSSLFLLLFCTLYFLLAGCNRKIDYFSYVSEFRNNIFLAETDSLSLRIYSVTKETPYAADGIAHESTARTEVFLLAPDGSQNYILTVYFNGAEYGGELAYDNVKSEYFLSFSLDVSAEKELSCVLSFGDTQIQLTATSVLRNETIAPNTILENVRAYDPELFKNMTDKYGFLGEIYLRLLYEDAPYYYVGVINRNGEIHAFLVNAITGKVLAHRKP
jgi:hypothetical protein